MLYIHHVINDYALSHLPLGWDTHSINIFNISLDEAELLRVILIFALFNVPSEALAAVCKAFDNGCAVLKMISG